MHRWHKDPVVWLMLLSTVLLLLFSAYWIKASHERATSVLEAEGNLLFRTAVLDLEDSLRTIAVEKYGWIRPGRPEPSDSSNITTILLEGDSMRTRTPRRQRGSSEHIRGALALQWKLANSDRTNLEVFKDRSAEPAIQDLVAKKVAQLQRADEVAYTFHFQNVRESSTKDLEIARSYRDVFTSQQIFASIRNYRPYIWRKILPAILLSFVMIGATLLAFLLMHRSMRKQARLAAMRSDLISNITHELQTPISTVRVALEALQNFTADENASDKTAEYLAISQLELTRLSFLVDTVLKNSITESSTSGDNEVIDLKLIIEAAIKSMSLQFEKRGAQINLDADLDKYLVVGDQIQLSSVIYNLLDNALKYSPTNPKIDIKLRSENQQVLLTINDQGIGIPKEYQRKIFERFFRVPQGNTHNIKGYGLGLTQVLQVIEQHRGKISVSSKDASGTQFLIKLPLHYEGA